MNQLDVNINLKVNEESLKRRFDEEKLPFEGFQYDPLTIYDQETINNYIQIGKKDYLSVLKKSCEFLESGLFRRTLKSCELEQQEKKQNKQQPAKSSLYNKNHLKEEISQMFKDPEFPHEISSLLGNDFSTRESWKAIRWYHPKEIANFQDYQLFKEQISPINIRQGYINNIYFIAAIVSLAEFPKRIKKLFTSQANPYGIHSVMICFRGEWKEIIVDEFIPCISPQRGPAFTRGIDGELWPILLEKAWAKLNDSYSQIETGITNDVLHDLTGAPTKTFWLDQEHERDFIWEKLIEAEKYKFVMTCGSSNNLKIENLLKENGIIPGHCYSLLGAYNLQTQQGNFKILRIRKSTNSSFEWNGRWSKNSQEYKNLNFDQKQSLDLEGTRNSIQSLEGIFLIQFEDFCKYFSDLQICYVHDDFQYSSISASTSKKDGKFFKFTVTQQGKYYILVNQKSKRFYSQEFQNNFQYAKLTLILAKREFDENGVQKITYIEGQQDNEMYVWTADFENQVLQQGEYLVYVKANWIYNNISDFVLSAYGVEQVKFIEITQYECPDMIKEVYRDHSLQVGKKGRKYIKGNEQNEKNAAWICINQTDEGFFYLVAENHTNEAMYCEFRFNRMDGLKLKKPFRGQFASFVLIPDKLNYEVVIFKVLDYTNVDGLSITQSIKFREIQKEK
ncbi:hypothetical protein IMG5_075640 [Ichthyophthirius multifiliis]|uniref:Calpain catalytic domain-containing protein n=1 Tax=Ichthyophthirius multifiliis TaxID=5932 RepID=G0QQ58_ICHMU|nr:hypothetical protein IMG5_075640 [Ichthyophthirius multifiliis]EGR32646.1 hypothetical protein IMG5_075640 [Ichthyophthirius multifiliis]|eukprot:XP_004036632.1 hypothetical protein IMG5_075640 [Ichthyophthirius multifiliis]